MAEHSIRKHLLLSITSNVNIFRPALDIFYSMYLKLNCKGYEQFSSGMKNTFLNLGEAVGKTTFSWH
jgi:hypothetical protein